MRTPDGSIVIVGSGLAGYALAREFRKLDSTTKVEILSRDHAGYYFKPMLSNALAMGKSVQSLLNAEAEKMGAQLNITISPKTHVIAIDSTRKFLILRDGSEVPYGRLVLAVGADPIRLSLNGEGAQDVISVNDLDDYRNFRGELDGKSEVLILGAGLIGCEFANDLVTAGYRVHLIDVSAWPLGRLLPEVSGLRLKRRLEDVGVVFHLNSSAQRIDKKLGRFHLLVGNGEVIVGDVVLSAIGLQPRTNLADASGIKINRGIVVNRFLQTSEENIFALGDCAEVEGKVLPFVSPIMHAARALAATLNGTPTPLSYPAMPVSVKLPACPTMVSPPDVSKMGEWSIQEDSAGVKALFENIDGDLLGFALIGEATKEKVALTARLPPLME